MATNPGQDIENLLRKYKETEVDERLDGQVPFVDWPRFNLMVGVIIMINSILIGLELDMNPWKKAGAQPISDRIMWYALENIFCVIFLAELIARLHFHKAAYFKSGMNLLDFFLVTMSILDTWVLTPASGGGDLRVLASLRVLRVLRLVRLIRLLRMFKELWLIVSGLIHSIKTLGWVSLLLGVVLYTGGIFCTMQIGQNDTLYDQYFEESGGWDHEIYFGTVPRSMFTLLQVATLERWSEGIARHVMQKQPAMTFFFLLFIIFATFGLMNLIVGVIVENTISTAKHNDAKIKQQNEKNRIRILAHLREIFEMADEDGSGTLTAEEVEHAIQNPEVANKLRIMDFPLHNPAEFFLLLDTDSSGVLSIEEFIGGCMRLKGNAKSKDLLAVQVNIEALGKRLIEMQNALGESVEKIGLLDDKTRHMMSQAEEVFLDPKQQRQRASVRDQEAQEAQAEAARRASAAVQGRAPTPEMCRASIFIE